jgi:type VI secretion system protein
VRENRAETGRSRASKNFHPHFLALALGSDLAWYTMKFPAVYWGSAKRTAASFVLGACCLVAAAGCSSGYKGQRLRLEVATTARANKNSPVPITLVAVQDPKLFERISKLTAKQWYEQREQIRRDYPSGTAFAEWDWEFVPGQSPPPMVIEVDSRSVGAIIFANYRAPGDHRFRVGPQRRMRIDLGDDDFVVSPLDAPEE